MKWIDDNNFEINGVSFFTAYNMNEMFGRKPEGSFLIAKKKDFLDKHQVLLDKVEPRNIFELGIFRGGSTVWLNELFTPDKLVAIDYSDKPIKQLESYLDENNLRNTVKTFYGVDQKNISMLHKIYCEEFSQQKLDLVLDDASHLLDETRQSFNYLFPRLRPGGLFIIEDWGWSHDPMMEDERVAKRFVGKPPLSTLLMEIMLACPRLEGVIKEVYFDKYCAYVVRGDEDVSEDGFDISCSYTVHENWRLADGLFSET